MFDSLLPFLLQWGITALSLWVCGHVFAGIRFANVSSLLVAALLLGIANTFVRPLLVLLTLPLTLITLGFFLLVINALMIQLVSALVKGFQVSGFWTAFFASLLITLLGFLFHQVLIPGEAPLPVLPEGGTWL